MTIASQRPGKHVPEVTLLTIEGRPLLGNGSLDTFSQQRISTKGPKGGLSPTPQKKTNKHTITEELLEVLPYIRSSLKL
jgi:hypothetical protein